jgi:hypothetical protein
MGGLNEVLAVLLLAAKYGLPVWPHAGGVGLCEYVQHLSMIDYVAVSGTKEGRVIEYVDHLHEHFLDPASSATPPTCRRAAWLLDRNEAGDARQLRLFARSEVIGTTMESWINDTLNITSDRRPADLPLCRASPRSNGAHTQSGPPQPSRLSGLQIFGRALPQEISARPVLGVDHTVVDRLLLLLE